MKKLVTLFIALAVTFAVKAQWVNNPATNTFLANTSADAGEVYLAKSPNGDTYNLINKLLVLHFDIDEHTCRHL